MWDLTNVINVIVFIVFCEYFGVRLFFVCAIYTCFYDLKRFLF